MYSKKIEIVCLLCSSVCVYCCYWGLAFSAVCLLMRGDLTDCHMWLILRRAALCSTPTPPPTCPARPHLSCRIPFKSKRKLTLTHLYKSGSCQSHTMSVCAWEPFRRKITLPNQSLIESLTSSSGQSKAHNVPSPRNDGQSVAHNACRCYVDPDKM